MEMLPTVADPQRLQLTLRSPNTAPRIHLYHMTSAIREISLDRLCAMPEQGAPISSMTFIALVGVPRHSFTQVEVVILLYGCGRVTRERRCAWCVVLGSHQTLCFNQMIRPIWESECVSASV